MTKRASFLICDALLSRMTLSTLSLQAVIVAIDDRSLALCRAGFGMPREQQSHLFKRFREPTSLLLTGWALA